MRPAARVFSQLPSGDRSPPPGPLYRSMKASCNSQVMKHCRRHHGIGAGVKLVALVGDEVRGAKYIVVLLKDAATQFAFRFFREAKMPCQTLYPSGNECPGTPRKKNPAEWRG